MPRRARLRIAEQPLHVMQRGVDHADCFRTEGDRRLYLGLLEELSIGRCAVHAYVLMTNHVHLLLSPLEADSCSRMMKDLGQRYAQHCNRTWRRSGPLWEGRFKSNIVDSEGYLMTCQRYIEQNPVRAGMVRCAAAYPWSSFQANAYGVASRFLTPHAVYLALAPSEEERQENYRALFDQPEDPAQLAQIREAIRGGFALGSKAFIADVERALGRRVHRKRRSKAVATHTNAELSGLSPV
jgi:putative transposase